MLLITHALATAFLAGLIWVVQMVHYPLMAEVGHGRYRSYHSAHIDRITKVVAPAMLFEAATALWILVAPPDGVDPSSSRLAFAMVVAIWTSTAALSVPAHRTLADRFDPAAHQFLVSTNWPRTILWTLRTVIAASWLALAS